MNILGIVEGVLDKYLLPNKHFQDYVSMRYNSSIYTLIKTEYLKNVYCKYGKYEFLANQHVNSIDEVVSGYKFSDIRKTDIVLDIGANIGAFTILASEKAKVVYAVEPLFMDILENNLSKNNIKNVKTINVALGNYNMKKLKYVDREEFVNFIPLEEIIYRCGGHVDFLKCDCEGGEWSISPDELDGIRRIEIEVHSFKGMPKLKEFLVLFDMAGFKYRIEYNPKRNDLMTVHALRKE